MMRRKRPAVPCARADRWRTLVARDSWVPAPKMKYGDHQQEEIAIEQAVYGEDHSEKAADIGGDLCRPGVVEAQGQQSA